MVLLYHYWYHSSTLMTNRIALKARLTLIHQISTNKQLSILQIWSLAREEGFTAIRIDSKRSWSSKISIVWWGTCCMVSHSLILMILNMTIADWKTPGKVPRIGKDIPMGIERLGVRNVKRHRMPRLVHRIRKFGDKFFKRLRRPDCKFIYISN